MAFRRITVDPQQMGGVPCIRGRRISIATIVSMVADGMTRDEILSAYPDLEAEDIREALRFAAEALQCICARRLCASQPLDWRRGACQRSEGSFLRSAQSRKYSDLS